MANNGKKGTALITGASSGIGAVYADRLARRGYDLVLVARDAGRLNKLAATLRGETGVAVDVLPADLADKSALAAVETRLQTDEKISLLVNNAGLGLIGSFADVEIERAEALIQVNVLALTRLASAVAGSFVRRKAGAIINVASVLALAPEFGGAVYAGTKAYVLNFTQALALELANTGVQLQTVLPGATRTEIFDRAGGSIASIAAENLMEVGDMVDAALVGFDRGEVVTIPSLPDVSDWESFAAARMRMLPNLSRSHPADRYLAKATV